MSFGLSFVDQSVAQCSCTVSASSRGRRLIVSASPEASLVHQYWLTISPYLSSKRSSNSR
jgi:hypothetical protein